MSRALACSRASSVEMSKILQRCSGEAVSIMPVARTLRKGGNGGRSLVAASEALGKECLQGNQLTMKQLKLVSHDHLDEMSACIAHGCMLKVQLMRQSGRQFLAATEQLCRDQLATWQTNAESTVLGCKLMSCFGSQDRGLPSTASALCMWHCGIIILGPTRQWSCHEAWLALDGNAMLTSSSC